MSGAPSTAGNAKHSRLKKDQAGYGGEAKLGKLTLVEENCIDTCRTGRIMRALLPFAQPSMMLCKKNKSHLEREGAHAPCSQLYYLLYYELSYRCTPETTTAYTVLLTCLKVKAVPDKGTQLFTTYRHALLLVLAAGLCPVALQALRKQTRIVSGRVLAMVLFLFKCFSIDSYPAAMAAVVEGGAVEHIVG
jgi:hypothetical protein